MYLADNGNLYSQFSASKDSTKKNRNEGNLGSSLLGGITYYSNTNTLGIYSIDIVQPSISPSVGYLGKSGIMVSVTPFFIKDADTTYNNTATELDFLAGYRWEFNSLLSLTPTYVHFAYSANMNLFRSAFSDYFALVFNAQNTWFIGNLTTAYVLGTQNEFVMESQTGFNISLDKLMWKNQLLLVQPMVNLTLNDQYYYHRYAYLYYPFLLTYEQSNPQATIGNFREYLTGNPQNLWVKAVIRYLDKHPKIDKSYEKLKSSVLISNLFAVKTRFNLSYIEIPVQVTWSFNNFIIRAGTSAYKPVNAPSFVDSRWNVLYTVGLNYMVSW